MVGSDGGATVAVGRIFPGLVHADRYWTEIVVAPDQRRRGHGRDVARHLARLRPDDRWLCARGTASSAAVLFARSLGARDYQTCPPERVNTADAARLATTSVGVVPVPGTEVDPRELRRAWTETYAWVHEGWSPVAPGFAEPLLAGFDADLDLEHTRVVADPRIRAAAFVFHDDPKPVVVAECRSRAEPDGPALLRVCVRDSLLSLAADSVATISFDGHDTDPHFRPLLDELPTSGEPFRLVEWT